MDFLKALLDFILHIDKNLLQLTKDYDMWVYLIVSLILFAETGLVVTPFLPGDSLLFAAGALCATGSLNFMGLAACMIVAVFIGDNTNYFIGRTIGNKLIALNLKLLKKEN